MLIKRVLKKPLKLFEVGEHYYCIGQVDTDEVIMGCSYRHTITWQAKGKTRIEAIHNFMGFITDVDI